MSKKKTTRTEKISPAWELLAGNKAAGWLDFPMGGGGAGSTQLGKTPAAYGKTRPRRVGGGSTMPSTPTPGIHGDAQRLILRPIATGEVRNRRGRIVSTRVNDTWQPMAGGGRGRGTAGCKGGRSKGVGKIAARAVWDNGHCTRFLHPAVIQGSHFTACGRGNNPVNNVM